MKWYLHGCLVCGGDLFEHLDDPQVATCLMCTKTFPVAAVIRPGIVATESDEPRDFLAPLAESRFLGVAEAPHPSEQHPRGTEGVIGGHHAA